MNVGISIVVWPDGLVRVQRGLTEAQHIAAMAALSHKFITCCWSEDQVETATYGTPERMVGYCRMGHTEIWTAEIVCPLCAMIQERDNFRTLCQADTAAIKEKWKKEANE